VNDAVISNGYFEVSTQSAMSAGAPRSMRAAAKERRSRVRQKSFLQGRVFFNKGRSSFDCLVRDFSELGAKVKVSENATLPEVVEL